MFADLRKRYNLLCSPAQLYVFMSLLSIVVMFLQNMTETRKYTIGMFTRTLSFSNLFMFLAKMVYVVVWAIILDSLCKNGYKDLAWTIVLLPFVLMFVLIGLMML